MQVRPAGPAGPLAGAASPLAAAPLEPEEARALGADAGAASSDLVAERARDRAAGQGVVAGLRLAVVSSACGGDARAG